MPLALYMDHHVPKAITNGLRARGVDVITAHEDGTDQFDDPELLDRANELHRILYTQDDDLLIEATRRMQEGISFHGVIYGHQLRVSIGGCVRDLEIMAKAGEAEDIINQV